MHDSAGAIASLTTYEQLGLRVQRLVAEPKVQKRMRVQVHRKVEESPIDWRRLACDLAATDGVVVDEYTSESFTIAWAGYIDVYL